MTIARIRLFLVAWLVVFAFDPVGVRADCGVWEKVEITFQSQKSYGNPYTEVSVWVDLKGGNVEPQAKTRMWEVIQWPSGAQMRHLARFVLSEGRAYQSLVPHAELVSPNRSGPEKDFVGWAYCARTDDKKLFLIYFEKDCPQAKVSGAIPGESYDATWFDPRTGARTEVAVPDAESDGSILLPTFPDGSSKSNLDWALKLTLAGNS